MKPLHIRSYVRRQGRMTERQKYALTHYWSDYGIDLDVRLNVEKIFPVNAPWLLEIGFGMGNSLAQLAAEHSDWNFIGIDVHRPGIGSLLSMLHEKKLNNVKIIEHDAIDLFRRFIQPDSLDMIQILYPDPWPKRRHHKRRLIQTSFLDLILPALKTNGLLFIATDWEDYARHIQSVLNSHIALKSMDQNTLKHPLLATRSQTKFETRGLKKGHGIFEFFLKQQI